jgi:hypothetical protein
LVLGHLFHEFVFVLAVFSFVQVMDYDMLHVSQVLDYFDDVEVFQDFVFAQGHDSVHLVDHGPILFCFKES